MKDVSICKRVSEDFPPILRPEASTINLSLAGVGPSCFWDGIPAYIISSTKNTPDFELFLPFTATTIPETRLLIAGKPFPAKDSGMRAWLSSNTIESSSEQRMSGVSTGLSLRDFVYSSSAFGFNFISLYKVPTRIHCSSGIVSNFSAISMSGQRVFAFAFIRPDISANRLKYNWAYCLVNFLSPIAKRPWSIFVVVCSLINSLFALSSALKESSSSRFSIILCFHTPGSRSGKGS
mmetsp:Transcript_17885/g.33894  ORF Transcript_17885/g.33894 Transcript_17885/m.33894 type:complete len:236 (-) Transcript_17885:39-746(-)